MPIDIDFAAIAIMESLGTIAFLEAFIFFRQRQRIANKQRMFLDALKRGIVGERGDGKCYSSEWVLDNIVYKPRSLADATPLLMAVLAFLVAVSGMLSGRAFLVNIIDLGYATLVAVIGVAILLWTDAFQAYGYTNAIHKVALEQLDKEDRSYLELAGEAVEKAFLRFVSLGFAFALLGPFTPQIFNGVFSVSMLYATLFFQATEASYEVSAIFGILIILVLPALMLSIPELLGRILVRKGKSVAHRIFKRKVEQ